MKIWNKMKKMGYYETLGWLLFNDDTEFLNDKEPIVSVAVCLVADIFGKDQNQIVKDLLALREKRKKEGLL